MKYSINPSTLEVFHDGEVLCRQIGPFLVVNVHNKDELKSINSLVKKLKTLTNKEVLRLSYPDGINKPQRALDVYHTEITKLKRQFEITKIKALKNKINKLILERGQVAMLKTIEETEDGV